MNKTHKWQPNFYQNTELFKPITPAFQELNFKENCWPTLHDFQSLITSTKRKIVNAKNLPIRFVNQSTHCESFEEEYEPRIYLKGEIQTRTENWHDFFQVLVWKTFPLSKVLLNSFHYDESMKRLTINPNNRQRSTVENFLTLFDECGIVIVSSSSYLLDLIKEFEWTSLFWTNREELHNNLECFVFGHAMYEKAINPYIGMTANAILISVETDFFEYNYKTKIDLIDQLIVARISNEKLLSPRILNPFPLLGVPGWQPENGSFEFYKNDKYFRKKKK